MTGWVWLLLGLLLAAGGVWLAVLGDSADSIGLGIRWLATSWLLILRRRACLVVYTMLLICTATWALWEVGLDRRALMSRGALFTLIGLWLLTSWISRSGKQRAAAVSSDLPIHSSWRGPRDGLDVMMILVIVTALLSMMRDRFDIGGTLHQISMTDQNATIAAASAAGDDWTVYGGEGYGERHPFLAEITAKNVSNF